MYCWQLNHENLRIFYCIIYLLFPVFTSTNRHIQKEKKICDLIHENKYWNESICWYKTNYFLKWPISQRCNNNLYTHKVNIYCVENCFSLYNVMYSITVHFTLSLSRSHPPWKTMIIKTRKFLHKKLRSYGILWGTFFLTNGHIYPNAN